MPLRLFGRSHGASHASPSSPVENHRQGRPEPPAPPRVGPGSTRNPHDHFQASRTLASQPSNPHLSSHAAQRHHGGGHHLAASQWRGGGPPSSSTDQRSFYSASVRDSEVSSIPSLATHDRDAHPTRDGAYTLGSSTTGPTHGGAGVYAHGELSTTLWDSAATASRVSLSSFATSLESNVTAGTPNPQQQHHHHHQNHHHPNQLPSQSPHAAAFARAPGSSVGSSVSNQNVPPPQTRSRGRTPSMLLRRQSVLLGSHGGGDGGRVGTTAKQRNAAPPRASTGQHQQQQQQPPPPPPSASNSMQRRGTLRSVMGGGGRRKDSLRSESDTYAGSQDSYASHYQTSAQQPWQGQQPGPEAQPQEVPQSAVASPPTRQKKAGIWGRARAALSSRSGTAAGTSQRFGEPSEAGHPNSRAGYASARDEAIANATAAHRASLRGGGGGGGGGSEDHRGAASTNDEAEAERTAPPSTTQTRRGRTASILSGLSRPGSRNGTNGRPSSSRGARPGSSRGRAYPPAASSAMLAQQFGSATASASSDVNPGVGNAGSTPPSEAGSRPGTAQGRPNENGAAGGGIGGREKLPRSPSMSSISRKPVPKLDDEERSLLEQYLASVDAAARPAAGRRASDTGLSAAMAGQGAMGDAGSTHEDDGGCVKVLPSGLPPPPRAGSSRDRKTRGPPRPSTATGCTGSASGGGGGGGGAGASIRAFGAMDAQQLQNLAAALGSKEVPRRGPNGELLPPPERKSTSSGRPSTSSGLLAANSAAATTTTTTSKSSGRRRLLSAGGGSILPFGAKRDKGRQEQHQQQPAMTISGPLQISAPQAVAEGQGSRLGGQPPSPSTPSGVTSPPDVRKSTSSQETRVQQQQQHQQTTQPQQVQPQRQHSNYPPSTASHNARKASVIAHHAEANTSRESLFPEGRSPSACNSPSAASSILVHPDGRSPGPVVHLNLSPLQSKSRTSLTAVADPNGTATGGSSTAALNALDARPEHSRSNSPRSSNLRPADTTSNSASSAAREGGGTTVEQPNSSPSERGDTQVGEPPPASNRPTSVFHGHNALHASSPRPDANALGLDADGVGVASASAEHGRVRPLQLVEEVVNGHGTNSSSSRTWRGKGANATHGATAGILGGNDDRNSTSSARDSSRGSVSGSSEARSHLPATPSAGRGSGGFKEGVPTSATELWQAYHQAQRRADQAMETLEAERSRCRQLIQRCLQILELHRSIEARRVGARRDVGQGPCATTAGARQRSASLQGDEERLQSLVAELATYLSDQRWEGSEARAAVSRVTAAANAAGASSTLAPLRAVESLLHRTSPTSTSFRGGAPPASPRGMGGRPSTALGLKLGTSSTVKPLLTGTGRFVQTPSMDRPAPNPSPPTSAGPVSTSFGSRRYSRQMDAAAIWRRSVAGAMQPAPAEPRTATAPNASSLQPQPWKRGSIASAASVPVDSEEHEEAEAQREKSAGITMEAAATPAQRPEAPTDTAGQRRRADLSPTTFAPELASLPTPSSNARGHSGASTAASSSSSYSSTASCSSSPPTSASRADLVAASSPSPPPDCPSSSHSHSRSTSPASSVASDVLQLHSLPIQLQLGGDSAAAVAAAATTMTTTTTTSYSACGVGGRTTIPSPPSSSSTLVGGARFVGAGRTSSSSISQRRGGGGGGMSAASRSLTPTVDEGEVADAAEGRTRYARARPDLDAALRYA